MLTIAGDLAFRWQTQKSAFRAAMKALHVEVVRIDGMSRSRETPPFGGAVSQAPPLPTLAWRSLITSGLLSKLKSSDLAVFTDFYGDVEAANYLSGQAPMLLQTANLASDPDVQRLFADEARRLTSAPFTDVASKSVHAIAITARFNA